MRLPSWVQRCSARLRFNRSYGAHRGVLRLTDGGFELQRYKLRGTVIQLETCWSVHWDDVVLVIAYTRGLITYDLICLTLNLVSDSSVEVDEEMEGFWELTESLARVLQGGEGDWSRKVAFPSLADNENAAILWRADVRSSSSNRP